MQDKRRAALNQAVHPENLTRSESGMLRQIGVLDRYAVRSAMTFCTFVRECSPLGLRADHG